MGKRIVIALGGNALGSNLPEQMIAVKQTAKAIVDLIEEGHEVIIAHGNGPQVGMIQKAMGGELFLIQTEETYPISYDETIDAGQQEQSADARPALAAQVENLDDYDTVFLGFPNWWGDMPMAVYSFLDEYDLSGKTIVPFVTSGGSGFSSTERTIAELEPDATVLDGLSVGDGNISGAQEDVTSWLTDLGLIG